MELIDGILIPNTPGEKLRIRVLAFARDNVGGDFTVARLQREAGYRNEAHFRDLFARVMGSTPKRWIRTVKVDAVRKLLEETAAPLGDIARMTGFCHSNHLVMTFRVATGETPNDYRLRVRGGELPPEPMQERLDRRRKRGWLKTQVQAVERELIHTALIECAGNVSRTARRLGIGRRTLQQKLDDLSLRSHVGGPGRPSMQPREPSNLSTAADYWRGQTSLAALHIPLTDLLLGRTVRPELEVLAAAPIAAVR